MKKMTTTRFIACWLCLCPVLCMAQDRYNDSLALVALYSATDGANWTNTWDLTQAIDSWYGVNLNGNERVNYLDLSGNQLSGNMPPEIGNLTDLGGLYLHGNNLTGNIPTAIGNLTGLYTLNLSFNQLAGNIPVEVMTLSTNLGWLYLGNNQFNGSIPPQFGNMTNLVVLGLEYNELSGNIPPEIGDMTDLQGLNLSANQLSGSIPPEFGNLTNLQHLYLTYNQLTGSIPSEIGNLTNLISLYLYHNQLTGSIPTTIGNLTNLKILSAYRNQLTGNIPATIGNMTNLGEILLASNELNGSIPATIGDLDSLTALVLSDNQLTGNVPPTLGNLSKLTGLFLNTNELTGSIPVELGNLTKLTGLVLYDNELTGSIPAELGNLTNLIDLNLSSNQLTGDIPTTIESLINLEHLVLYHNQLTGSIPAMVGDLTNLKSLWISANNLTDTIPNLGNLTQLERLDLAYNELSGNFPDIGSYNLKVLAFQSNQITGNIPSIIGSLTGLTYFSIADNQISGNIPDFSTSPGLLILHYYNNRFSHEDIATNHNSNSFVSDFAYASQYYGNEQFHTDTIGKKVVLAPDPPIPYDAPSIIWLQNGWYKTFAYTLNDTTYTIASLDTTDIGAYQYRFIDSTLTPLVEFYSLPVNNYVDGLDLEGEPITQGELIIEYGIEKSQLEIDSIRNELSTDYGGIILDSCGCKVKLNLWKFGEDNIDLVREKISIDGVHERRTSSTEIDGNRNNLFVPDYTEAEYIFIGESVNNPNDTTKVVVGLIDTGINVYHNAVYDNLWNNPIEKNGIPGIDDDQNGYVDDVYGYDFIRDSLMHDAHGHGTKVGGIITANTPEDMDIQVMPVRAFNEDGRGSLFDMLCGLYYAIENGADIINISAGYRGEKSTIFQRALQYGRNNDVIFVVAAGNDTLDLNRVNYWPATFARDTILENTVISVTAIDSTYQLLEYANYGDTTVMIAAFGQNVLAPAGYDLESFDYIGGTSASTPIISLALGMEKIKYPNKSRVALYNDFLNNADISADLMGLVEEGRMLNFQTRQLSKLKVFLEGALLNTNSTNNPEMRTNLNQRGLLPGQNPLSPVSTPTPPGQPYIIAPWNYTGTEWGSTDYYMDDRVDWVLVSLRTEKESSTEIYRTAAQVKKNGTVEFYRPIMDLTGIADSVYIVVEHRNHMAVMSPEKIPIYDGRFVYDFTIEDSFRNSAAIGQVEIAPGIWAMIVGDGSQENDFPYYDINGNDKAIWVNENGNYDQYTPSDYDMNGDVNGNDKAIWVLKTGLFNQVPK